MGKIITALTILFHRRGCLIKRQSHSKPIRRNHNGARGNLPVKKSKLPPTPRPILAVGRFGKL